jgi:hypothetical protein
MAGYSGTPLVKKLGMREGARCGIVSEPPAYWQWLAPLPNIKVVGRGPIDFAHLFVRDRAAFERQFLSLKKRMAKDGMLWVSWPKKSSKVATDLDENIIRDYGLRNGLVDVKVCAVDDVWSGLKFVYRVEDRK